MGTIFAVSYLCTAQWYCRSHWTNHISSTICISTSVQSPFSTASNPSHHPLPHVTNVHTAVEQCTVRSTKWIGNGDIMYSCGPIYMCGKFNYNFGTISNCKFKVNILVSLNKCTLLYTINDINCYIFRHGIAILRESSHQSYTINITIYVPLLPICCWYVINGVSHSECVGWYIDCKNMHSGNNRKLQNGWINMWTEGTVAVSRKAYNGITGVLGHQLVWKRLEAQIMKWYRFNRWSGSTSRTLVWDNPSSCVKPRDLSGSRPTAAIM